MKYPTKRLIIWRSLVQAQAGPHKKPCKCNVYKASLFVICLFLNKSGST
jgi:hypothetical protein